MIIKFKVNGKLYVLGTQDGYYVSNELYRAADGSFYRNPPYNEPTFEVIEIL